jgi:hypothetical protein
MISTWDSGKTLVSHTLLDNNNNNNNNNNNLNYTILTASSLM